MFDKQGFSRLVRTHVLTLLGAVAEGAPRTSCKDRVSRNMSGLAIDHKHTRRVNSELPNATPMHTNRRSRLRPRRRATPDDSERRDGVLLQRRAQVKGARREKRGAGCDADLSPSPSCQNRLEIKAAQSQIWEIWIDCQLGAPTLCRFSLCLNKIYGTATISISPGSS